MRDRRENGAVLVEFAFVLPFLALMAFGIAEMGLAWQDRMVVQTGARAGVRVGSAAGTSAVADKSTLLSVGSALNDVGLSNVDWVLVFKSTTTSGVVPATCTGPSPHSVAGSCNAYTGAQLQQVVAGTAPSSWFGCGAGSLDSAWCPTNRQAIQAIGTDYLGVWVSARHPMVTGFFGTVLTIKDHAVMQIEPATS